MKSRKHTPTPHVYRIAELASWGRFRDTIAQVGGEWSNQDEAHAALESECKLRGINMDGRRVIFTAIPRYNSQWLDSLRRTVDRYECPVWTPEEVRGALKAQEVAA